MAVQLLTMALVTLLTQLWVSVEPETSQSPLLPQDPELQSLLLPLAEPEDSSFWEAPETSPEAVLVEPTL